MLKLGLRASHREFGLVCADVELLLGSLNLRFATAHIVKHDHCNNKEPQRRAKREPEIPAREATHTKMGSE